MGDSLVREAWPSEVLHLHFLEISRDVLGESALILLRKLP